MIYQSRKGYNKQYYSKNSERLIERQKEWNKAHAEEMAAYQRKRRLEKLKCEWCGKSFNYPGYVLKYKRKHFCDEDCLGKYLVDTSDDKIMREWIDTKENIETCAKERWAEY